jgi:hypothetical protein
MVVLSGASNRQATPTWLEVRADLRHRDRFRRPSRRPGNGPSGSQDVPCVQGQTVTVGTLTLTCTSVISDTVRIDVSPG